MNVVCCVGRVEIKIEIQKGQCTANTDSIVQRFEHWPFSLTKGQCWKR